MIPVASHVQFGTLHVLAPGLKKALKDIAPPRVIDRTDYDSPDFDPNNPASYRLVNGGVIFSAEAVTVAVGDDSFHSSDHYGHEMTDGIHKGKFCMVDGEEEELLKKRIQDISGSARDLGMPFEEYWSMRMKRLDMEFSRLIAEAQEKGTINEVDVPTGIARVEQYISELRSGVRERLALYRKL